MKKLTASIFVVALLGSICGFCADRVNAKDVYESSLNPVKEFFMGKQKYIEIDSVKVRMSPLFGKLKASESNVIYNPESQQAGLTVNFQTMMYNIVFNEDARNLIEKSLEQYKKDFDAKLLIHNNNKSTKMYGSGDVYVEFGTFKTMMNHFAHSSFHVGYRFDNKVPYFVISVMEAKDEWTNEAMSERWVVPTITMYFTKEQATNFVNYISKDVLNVFHNEYLDLKNADTNEEAQELKNYETEDLDNY